MTQNRANRLLRHSQDCFPGLLLCSLVTAAVFYSNNLAFFQHLGLGMLTLAIIAGLLLGNSLYPQFAVKCHAGVKLSKQNLLRLGIILYGFRLTFQQISEVGLSGITIDLLTLTSTFFLARWIGCRLLGMDSHTVTLIGSGSSICGAAAILATEPIIKADASKVTIAVATVVIFGTIGMFLYPWIYQLVSPLSHGLVNPQNFGVYIGSTVHEVAQVVAAGNAISDTTGNAAVITKMIRVMMLAPFLLIIGQLSTCHSAGTTSKQKLVFPWFALLFILVAVINSLAIIPPDWVEKLVILDNFLLAMAMVALGLTTHFSAIRQAGLRPILLAACLFLWLIVGGAIINAAIVSLISHS